MAHPSKVLCRVTEVVTFSDGIYQITFAIAPRYTSFLPGQFLHLTLEDFDPSIGFWPDSRVFSIASEPKLNHVTIVYSVKGPFTQRMEKELLPGREVWLKLPYGSFSIEDNTSLQGPLVLIAGGTGVSPYRPFLLRPRSADRQIHLYYGIRKAEHFLFKSELIDLSKNSWFRLHLAVEEGHVPGLSTQIGRLSITSVSDNLGLDFGAATFYLSGPPSMIQFFKTDLLGRGIHALQIHIDDWE